MTPDELIDMATRAAKAQLETADQMVNLNITAAERLAARDTSNALSKVAVSLLSNPTH